MAGSKCSHEKAILVAHDLFAGRVMWCTECGSLGQYHTPPDGGVGRQERWRWRAPGEERPGDANLR